MNNKMINHPFYLKLFLVILCVFLVSCTSTPKPEGKPLPEMTFSHYLPMTLDLAKVDIKNKYNPGADPADVSGTFPTSPDVALRLYAQNKLRTKGRSGQLVFTIEEAKVLHSVQESDNKLSRWLKQNRTETYEMFISIKLDSIKNTGKLTTVLNMQKSFTLPESVSLAERELLQMTFLEGVVKDIDKALTESIINSHKIHIFPIEENIDNESISAKSLQPVSGEPMVLTSPEMRGE